MIEYVKLLRGAFNFYVGRWVTSKMAWKTQAHAVVVAFCLYVIDCSSCVKYKPKSPVLKE